MLDKVVFCPVCGAGPYRTHGGRHDHMLHKHGVTMTDYKDKFGDRLSEGFKTSIEEHPKAGKALVSTVATKTTSSPPQEGREIARGYAPVENPLKPAGLCENCHHTNCWGLCDAP